MYQDDNIQFNNFMRVYHNTIRWQYPEIERMRWFLLSLEILLTVVTVWILIKVYNFFDAAYSWASALPTLIAVGIFILIPAVCIFIYIYQKYRAYLKEKITYQVLKEFFNIETITETPDVLNCGLWPSLYSIIKIYDCFKMTYKNLECKIVELVIGKTGKNRDYYDLEYYFDGVVIQFSNNKKLNGKIIIRSKKKINLSGIIFVGSLLINLTAMFIILSLGYNIREAFSAIFPVLFLPMLISGIQCFYSKEKKNIQTTGSEGFRKHFDVYADNISELEMEVTPKLISKFFNLKSRFRNKPISCSFYEDKILFAIYGGNNLFEIGNLLVPINKSKTVYRFYNDINMIYEVMDYFFQ